VNTGVGLDIYRHLPPACGGAATSSAIALDASAADNAAVLLAATGGAGTGMHVHEHHSVLVSAGAAKDEPHLKRRPATALTAMGGAVHGGVHSALGDDASADEGVDEPASRLVFVSASVSSGTGKRDRSAGPFRSR